MPPDHISEPAGRQCACASRESWESRANLMKTSRANRQRKKPPPPPPVRPEQGGQIY
jgi:hypothetical protein